jgi:glycine betaine/proline transport system substrate-binding protein
MPARTLLVTLALLVLGTPAALAQPRSPGAGVELRPAVATWQSATPTEAVVRLLLTELGYEVEAPRYLSNPAFYRAVAEGTVDYWVNGWFPIHNTQLPGDFDGAAEVAARVVERGALEGYLVDAETAELLDVTSLADLARDEVRAAFDADGDGRADLVGCPPGWVCRSVIEHHLDSYGLDSHVEITEGPYAAVFDQALQRHRDGAPLLFYTWTPNYTLAELRPGDDVVWINVPEIVPLDDQQGLAYAMTASDVPGAVSDPVRLGFVANDIRAVARKALLADRPTVAALFEAVLLPREDVSAMTLRIRELGGGASAVDRVAEDWIAAHRDTVDGWLEEARAAAR